MSTMKLIHDSCADQKVDVVVNAANKDLLHGGGICHVIFTKAGNAALILECNKHKTPLKDGEVVLTDSCNMKNCKAIIHAVGPNFSVTPKAFKELFDAYYNCFKVLMNNGFHSISFPLISSGIFGGNLDNPVRESAKQFLRAYQCFVRDYPEYNVDAVLCGYGQQEYTEALKEFGEK